MNIRNVICPGLRRLLLLGFLIATSGSQATAAEVFAGNTFTDGTYFSAIYEREHFLVVPYVFGHYSRDNWLVCWKIDALKQGQLNSPQQTFFLQTLKSGLYIGLDFRASEPRTLILREDHDNKQIALYEIRKSQPAKMLKAINHGDVETNRSWVCRSEKYFFLRVPGPAIYSATNLSPLKAVTATSNLEAFYAAHGWWPNVLTDDLRYLIKPLWEYSDQSGVQYFDQASCYNLNTDELQTVTIHSGTNRTEIVDAESANNHLQFLAFWHAERPELGGNVFTHLGVFDEKSHLISEIVVPAMNSTDFSRTAVWDYAHSNVFFFSDPTLTEYDYGQNLVRKFTLDPGKLKVP